MWSEDGQRLYSCGEDGQLCEWDLLSKQIRTQVKPDGGALVALTALTNGNLIVATEEGSILEVASNGQVSDRTKKEHVDNVGTCLDGAPIFVQVMARVKSVDLFATCLQFLSRDQVVLVGTKTGSVRAYKYPLSNRSEFLEHFTQLGSISHVSRQPLLRLQKFLLTIRLGGPAKTFVLSSTTSIQYVTIFRADKTFKIRGLLNEMKYVYDLRSFTK